MQLYITAINIISFSIIALYVIYTLSDIDKHLSSFLRCKERHYVNGMSGKTQYFKGNILFVEVSDKSIPVFAIYDNGQEYFPIVAGYASTVHKVMRQTLKHVTFTFDIPILSPTIRYVALSRVSSIDNVVPLLRLRKSHFINYDH